MLLNLVRKRSAMMKDVKGAQDAKKESYAVLVFKDRFTEVELLVVFCGGAWKNKSDQEGKKKRNKGERENFMLKSPVAGFEFGLVVIRTPPHQLQIQGQIDQLIIACPCVEKPHNALILFRASYGWDINACFLVFFGIASTTWDVPTGKRK
jgi:hypothetical protein